MVRPSLTCSGSKTVGAFCRFELTRTPTLGPRFPPAPTGTPDEIGLVEANSHRTACENRADMTHLILALVPFETAASRNQRSTSTVFTFRSSTRPQRGRIQFLAYERYPSCVEKSLKGSSSR